MLYILHAIYKTLNIIYEHIHGGLHTCNYVDQDNMIFGGKY